MTGDSYFKKFVTPTFAYYQDMLLGLLVSELFLFFSMTFPSHVGTFGQQLQVSHCNYNGDFAPKF